MSGAHPRSRRKRGVILSLEGLQRLQEAQERSEIEMNGAHPYTLEALNQLTGLSPHTLTKVRRRKKTVDVNSLENYFNAFNLTLTPSDYSKEPSVASTRRTPARLVQRDWGEAMDVSIFYGRREELAMLEKWIQADRCRLVGVLGMGGIGKSALSVKLAQRIQAEFDSVVWRSLQNAPPLENLLKDLILFLSDQQDLETSLGRLIHWLKTCRCLVILDNVETILQAGDRAGQYRKGYEDYGALFRAVGEATHQSCVLLTSREKPAELDTFEGIDATVRSHQLRGSVEASLGVIEAKQLIGSAQQKQELCDRYGCSPLALKIVAGSIHTLFAGEISPFLEEGTFLFNGTQQLLTQQFERLSALEKTIMFWLAINREWTSIKDLVADIIPVVSKPQLLESLESLSWRSLIEGKAGQYTQQPVVMEFVTDRFIKHLGIGFISQDLTLFNRYTLLKTTVKDHIRQSQVRLILSPFIEDLRQTFSLEADLIQHLHQILDTLKALPTQQVGYGAGNFLNLCLALAVSPSQYDFSQLPIRQASLQGTSLHQVNFARASFHQCIFTQTFGEVLALAFSPDNQILAWGESNGSIRLWKTSADPFVDLDLDQHLLTIWGHTGWIYSINWHPQSQKLLCGSDDRNIKIWDSETGHCLKTLQGHSASVLYADWSPDGLYIASCSVDQTLKIWEVATGHCLWTLDDYPSVFWTVAWSPDGQTLASRSDDGMLCLWNAQTGECFGTMRVEGRGSRALAWSPDGSTLAVASSRHIITLWNFSTHQPVKALAGHSKWIYALAWSPDGTTLASASEDTTIRLWDAETGDCLQTLRDHQKAVLSIRWSADSKLLASGSYDQTLRLWRGHTGECCRTLKGHTNLMWQLSWSPDGTEISTSCTDSTIKVWDLARERCRAVLAGHQGWVVGVAWRPNLLTAHHLTSSVVASASVDGTIKLWDVNSKQCLHTLKGHTSSVWFITWHPHGTQLASSSNDNDLAIRLWDPESGECIRILSGHQDWVRQLAWHPHGHMLASASNDRTIKLWDVETGDCLTTWRDETLAEPAIAWRPDGQQLAVTSGDYSIKLWNVEQAAPDRVLVGHEALIWSVAWSRNGSLLVSGSDDQTLKLWDVLSGELLQTLTGHSARIFCTAFSPDDQTLASVGTDGTLRLWEVASGRCLKVLKLELPYEGMNIAGVTGLTDAQLETLKALGAVE